MNPHRSLVARIIWLMIALAASFAVAASIWVGRVAREIVVQQHVRRLELESSQLASDLGQAVRARLDALRSASAAAPADVFRQMVAKYPDLDWIAVADTSGSVLASTEGILASNGGVPAGRRVSDEAWFSEGLKSPWIGVIDEARASQGEPLLGDVSAPVRDSEGRIVGVIAAHLNWHWAWSDVQRLNDTASSHGTAQTLVLDRLGRVLVGPDSVRNRQWNGVATGEPAPVETAPIPAAGERAQSPRFERLPGGVTVLVARTPISIDGRYPTSAWQVQLSESRERVYQRANALALRILWISACLGAVTALAGALGARHLTNRLKRLTQSAAAVGRSEIAHIEIPSGRDEVSQLAVAFAGILSDLQQERTQLLLLSSELERRVAGRTREVQRLAEESRYAAIVRERLKIARDLHDTLAHSMMAMLSEIRLLRKLEAHDPKSLRDELARAEEVAHEGLNEARNAITQMRVNVVRDTGLGAALSKAFERFLDRTGLQGEFITEAEAARFGDERAETLFQMAEEALRNIERHAMATRAVATLKIVDVDLQLSLEDDGVGFDTDLPRQGHYGIVGLYEQAQLIGARLHIDSAPGRGTTLRILLRIVPEML